MKITGKLARITPWRYLTANTARNRHPSERKVARRAPANATGGKTMVMGQSLARSMAGPRLSAGLRTITGYCRLMQLGNEFGLPRSAERVEGVEETPAV